MFGSLGGVPADASALSNVRRRDVRVGAQSCPAVKGRLRVLQPCSARNNPTVPGIIRWEMLILRRLCCAVLLLAACGRTNAKPAELDAVDPAPSSGWPDTVAVRSVPSSFRTAITALDVDPRGNVWLLRAVFSASVPAGRQPRARALRADGAPGPTAHLRGEFGGFGLRRPPERRTDGLPHARRQRRPAVRRRAGGLVARWGRGLRGHRSRTSPDLARTSTTTRPEPTSSRFSRSH